MSRAGRRVALLSALAITASAVLAAGDRAPGGDPLAREIEGGLAYLSAHHDSLDFYQQVRDASLPAYQRAAQALHEGRRLLALQWLGAARVNLVAWQFVAARPGAMSADSRGLAAAWQRERDSLSVFLGPPSAAGDARAAGAPRSSGDPRARVATLHPAAIRALAEATLPSIPDYCDAALAYGNATQPVFMWFYVGVARAQRSFYDLCVALAEPGARPEPAFRSIAPELDSLHARVLAAYRPPASIDRHPEFIGVSAVIKEARELDAAGLHRGALLRYLSAVQRFALLQATADAKLDSATVADRLADFERRMKRERLDHSIAEVFVESARSDLASARADSVPPNAAAIVADVLPRYFAALASAPPVAAARPAPEATVTLVRWPYT